jgi:transposase
VLRAENKLLRKKVEHLIRIIHGSKSEKLDPDQLELMLGDGAKKPGEAGGAEDALAEVEKDIKNTAASKRRSPRKIRLPEDIPTKTEILVPDEVRENPDAWRKIAERSTVHLDYIPARFLRTFLVRPVYVRKDSLQGDFAIAGLPDSIAGKSMLTPSLLAHIVTSKFCDHLPLHRIERINAERHGVFIPRGVMAGWMETAADRLEPLWRLLASSLRKGRYVKADETPIPYLCPGNGKTKQGYLWLYGNPALDIVLYDWKTSRSAGCLDAVLRDGERTFRGVLQSDGYSAYHAWARQFEGIVEAGCWAHARRYFFDARHEDGQRAAHILIQIQKLFRIERQLDGLAPESRKYWRRRRSRPILRKLRRLIKRLQKFHLPKSGLGEAAAYALNQWERLNVFAHRGEVDIDNNSTERRVRPTKLGAKNWLFIGGEHTGWRSAVLYTMVENCRINRIDPYAWFKWVFEQLPGMTNQDDLSVLLPSACAGRFRSADQSAGCAKAA